MPDYPAYSVKTEDEKAEKLKSENKEQGSTNMGFEEHWQNKLFNLSIGLVWNFPRILCETYVFIQSLVKT